MTLVIHIFAIADDRLSVFYTTRLFQTSDRKGMLIRMAEDKKLKAAPKRDVNKVNHDTDDGDGKGELTNGKDRESLDLNVETAAHGGAATPGTGRQE